MNQTKKRKENINEKDYVSQTELMKIVELFNLLIKVDRKIVKRN